MLRFFVHFLFIYCLVTILFKLFDMFMHNRSARSKTSSEKGVGQSWNREDNSREKIIDAEYEEIED